MTRRRWYLSFVGDAGFLGACVVLGESMIDAVREAHRLRIDAVREAHRLRINPGGEVLGIEIPEENEVPVPMNVLLTKQQILESEKASTS